MAIVDALWSMFGNKNEGNKVIRVKATVMRRDEDGTVWVHIEGGVTETPVYSTTTDVAQGDVVTVRVEGGKAYIDGSNSDPSVGVRRMVQAIEPIAKDSKVAKALAGAADEASAAAQRIATEAQEAAQAVSQYFWQRSEDTQSDGAGTGAFVTEETQEDFLDAAGQGFPDLSDQHPHHNLLMNSLGIMLRTGLRNLVSITRSAIAFYDGLGNGAANVVASFGRYGAQIGSSGGQHVSIDSSGFSTYDGNTRTSLIGGNLIDVGKEQGSGMRFSNGHFYMRGQNGNVLFDLTETYMSYDGDYYYGFSITNPTNYSSIQMLPNVDDPRYSDMRCSLYDEHHSVKDRYIINVESQSSPGSFINRLVVSEETTSVYNTLDVQSNTIFNAKTIDFCYYTGGTHTSRITEDASGRLSIFAEIRPVAQNIMLHSSTVDRDGANPSSVTYGNAGIEFRDNNYDMVGQLKTRRETNGAMSLCLFSIGESNNGADVYNGLTIRANRDGSATYSCTSAANFRAAIGAAASSDRRLKTDLKPLDDDAVEFVRALKSYSYTINGERQVGLIAQDVYEADKWGTRMTFETEDGVDGLDEWERLGDGIPTWKLDYIRLLPPTITALQKAMERIDALEQKIADLEGRI